MTEETNGAAAPPADAAQTEPKASFLATQIAPGRFAMVPQNFGQIWRMAEMFAASGQMVPVIYRENPNSAAMAIMWGMELGVSAIQAIQGIAVINGRAAVWGDLQHGLVITHPDFVEVEEKIERAPDGSIVNAICIAKRKGRPDVERNFSMEDALRADLLSKDTYKKYPQRMLQMRARSWAERDQFADALKGLASADEMIDVSPATVPTETREVFTMPRAAVTVEHDAPAVDFAADGEDGPMQTADTDMFRADLAAMDDLDTASAAATKQRIREATPQQSMLHGAVTARKMAESRASGKPAGPLTNGERAMLTTYLEATNGAVTLQDVVDELGADVDKGNLQRALALIPDIAKRRAEGK